MRFLYASAFTSHACSCAFERYCSSTDKRAIGSFAEESENFIFPHEQVVVMDGRQVCDGVSIDSDWQSMGLKSGPRGELFHSMKIVDEKHFRLIYPDGEGRPV